MNTQQINEYWKQLESNYIDTKVNKNQVKMLDICVDFHKSLVRGYTGYGTTDNEAIHIIRRLREEMNLYNGAKRFMAIQGEVFPEVLTSYPMTYAWVMKVGDDDKLLRQLFPNWYYESYPQTVVKRQERDHFTGVIKTNDDYSLLMATFAYIVTEGNGADKILGIKVATEGHIKHIRVNMKYYSIEIKYADGCKSYHLITTKAKRAMGA